MYVIAEDTRLEGFIPHSYCTPYNSHLGELALSTFKKKLPRNQNSNEVEADVNVDAQGKCRFISNNFASREVQFATSYFKFDFS